MSSDAGKGVRHLRDESVLDLFQDAVDEVLIRHRSILDVLSKIHEADSRVARATSKAVTACGCISIQADRQRIPADADAMSVHQYVRSHIEGELCSSCREALELEMGQALFYHTALATLLQLDLSTLLTDELRRLRTLGIYNLT
jgi:hypothetical protein